MAIRPVYQICLEGDIYYKEILVDFDWHGRDNIDQIHDSIRSLHENYKPLENNANILEVSTKSPIPLGSKLSAFNLTILLKNNLGITVESAFQGSKVFQLGGPYQDIYFKSSKEAKQDQRIRNSGEILGFKYFKREFEKYPKTFFYDWLYINTLYLYKEVHKSIENYTAFTDIEFNHKKSINCQAKSLALFVSLLKRNELRDVIKDENLLKQILLKNSTNIEQISFFKGY
ncbi:DarT1-associated NADAR antitoxin family protein [Lysinibacillus sp. NPDC094403]|uniref:DarT1-associated NADAR antitoxin family protein n=1 Tax=Lysinibacillus sp. NPDC094403 TaxID=3390581 RepID=UPI003D04176E